jgi:primosomal protein N' (replication factor Y)
MKYPPIADVMVCLMVSKDEEEVTKMSKDIVNVIKNNDVYTDDIKIIGPADASVSKANDYYRKVVYLKSENYSDLIKIKDSVETWSRESVEFRKSVVYVDFNPQNIY